MINRNGRSKLSSIPNSPATAFSISLNGKTGLYLTTHGNPPRILDIHLNFSKISTLNTHPNQAPLFDRPRRSDLFNPTCYASHVKLEVRATALHVNPKAIHLVYNFYFTESTYLHFNLFQFTSPHSHFCIYALHLHLWLGDLADKKGDIVMIGRQYSAPRQQDFISVIMSGLPTFEIGRASCRERVCLYV